MNTMHKKHEKAQHVCKHYKTSKTLDSLFPPNSRFGKIRRKFREFSLVSEENGRRCCTSQGTAGYFYEKEKHLTQHYYMIHPYSKFRQYWEMLVVVEIFISTTVRPFLVSQGPTVSLCCLEYQISSLLTDTFEMADVGLNFITGYTDKETRTVVLETRKVFFHNIRQLCFFVNLVGSLPLEFLAYIVSTPAACPHSVFMFLIFVKIVKLVVLSRYILHIAKIYDWSDLCYRLVWTLLMMFSLIHWLSCLFYLIIYRQNYMLLHNMFEGETGIFYRHFTIFYMISSIFFFQNGLLTHLPITTMEDMMFASLILISTHLSNIVFVGLFVQLLGLTSTPLIEYEEMIQEVQKFLVQENLPKHIHNKVMKYFEFRFRHRYFREKIILDTLSPPLRQEIANFLCMNLLKNSQSIFHGISDELASALCLQMKFEVFLAGDVVIRAGKKAKKIYFIYCGSAVMYSANERELMHLYEGQQFGSNAFLPGYKYLITVIALEMSEFYSLRRHDFIRCAAEFPGQEEFVVKAANGRKVYLSGII